MPLNKETKHTNQIYIISSVYMHLFVHTTFKCFSMKPDFLFIYLFILINWIVRVLYQNSEANTVLSLARKQAQTWFTSAAVNSESTGDSVKPIFRVPEKGNTHTHTHTQKDKIPSLLPDRLFCSNLCIAWVRSISLVIYKPTTQLR